MKRVLTTAGAIIAIAAGLAACETATPYQPAPPGHAESSYGYKDYKVDSTHWRVTFSGNSMTTRETVEKYLLYRAAELALQQGFDWFETTDRHTERNTSFYADTDPFYHSGFWASYGWGWRPYWRYSGPWGSRSWDPWFGGPFWANDIDIQQVNRFEASTEIVMGKGPPPSGQRVFNAREVVQNLGPSIVKPRP